MTNQWFTQKVQKIDAEAKKRAQAHQATLTKPHGSLGRLEWLAEQFASWQGTIHPVINHITVTVFAGDHGICAQGVSAFPQAVTAQMVANFLSGGSAISVLSRALEADFSVVDMGTVGVLPNGLMHHKQLDTINLAPATADFTQHPAMTMEQLASAMRVGQQKIIDTDADLFIGGEMGIGNTTSASAIYAALLSLSPEAVVGPGTGVNQAGMQRKQQVIAAGLLLHKMHLENPYDILRCLGGFEIAGLVGSYIACAQKGIPILVDGFIATAAALLAVKLNSGVRDWLLFSHYSAEPGHRKALEYLQAEPLLDLGLRLGEGSGAAVAVSLIQSALLLHNTMATFTEAGVSENDT
ncbi:nicotinate-nucleotide--dimethylbenzimidazole phosphoribosyltransferase [Candidatus Endobugula sertula]|uniref:Nicotinate-nucleotide--dimethylbenzimidazole phosphoribosyltransferase n=1 Tax=Candidatus Endobugula sertula TaxID=62101 RepID=A0A1D2QQP9_9GAMM|nr:nicotinate-nucleotide--dimethylbenzimidazole phosphoribosyltransferase [Candidatus Endobugula sertula]